jgi:hypothetical protein
MNPVDFFFVLFVFILLLAGTVITGIIVLIRRKGNLALIKKNGNLALLALFLFIIAVVVFFSGICDYKSSQNVELGVSSLEWSFNE